MSGTTTGGGLHHAIINRGDGTCAMVDVPDDALQAMLAAIQTNFPDLYAQIMANLPTP